MREQGKGVLTLDAGDLFFKKFSNPILEDELKGITQRAYLIVESFNLMGYDAVGIGDDDLSLGKEFLLEISKRANFPFLSSNITDEDSGKLLFQPYMIKEINGLRVGIFSLFSPDFFLSPSDLRRKGLTFQAPFIVAQNIVKELQPKTDLIILLSHLGYQKDIELAQTIPGMHLIVGSHTGVNLSSPFIIKNTIVLQAGSKGMYAGRIDLTLTYPEQTFYNSITKKSLENSLNNINLRLGLPVTNETQKAQFQKSKEEIERSLQQLQGKNEFTNAILPLNEEMKELPDLVKLVEAFKLNFPEIVKSPSPPTPPPKRGVIPPKQ